MTGSKRCKEFWSKVGSFVLTYYLPIGLLAVILIGAVFPPPGVFFDSISFNYVSVPVIFLISGLKLKTDEIKTAFKSWRAGIVGVLSILLVTPAVGILLTNLLPFNIVINNGTVCANGSSLSLENPNCTDVNGSEVILRETPFGHEDLRTGFFFILVAPCTISSGIVMVSQLDGNYALALMLTVVTNVVAVFTIAPLLSLLADFSGGTLKLDIGSIVMRLSLTVLLPLLVGKALRYITKVCTFVERFGKSLRILSITMLIIIPWMKISVAKKDGTFSQVLPINIISILAWSLAIHTLYLLINTAGSFIFFLELASKKCVIILASQKTIAIAVSLISYLPDSGDSGLMTLPPIIFHMSQIIFDGVLVAIWAKIDSRKKSKTDETNESETPIPQPPEGFIMYESAL